jgi:N-acetylmuramoyl-L-alanine amidase
VGRFGFHRYWRLVLLAAPLALAVAAFRSCEPAAAVPAPVVAARPAAIVAAARPAAAPSSPRLAATATSAPPAPTDTPVPASPTPSVEPTPTPRPPGAAPRVGLQAGHWKTKELPDELARLRTSTGAIAAGYAEVDVNLDIAGRVAKLLEQHGIVVDILPATVPVDYDADVFVTIHADGSRSPGVRGFKLSTAWRASRASQQLSEALRQEYAAATGLPWDDGVTFNMRGYYAFNYRRHEHAVKKTTPAVIVEMGFLTSAADRALMIGRPNLVAAGIANGILRYLQERDPNDGAALLPPEFRSQRPISPDGVDVRSAPRDDAPVLLHAEADRRFNPLQERDGWYQVFVRVGESRLTGWVRKDQLMATNDPTPTPLPSTDS